MLFRSSMQNSGKPIEKIFLLANLAAGDRIAARISDLIATIPVIVPDFYRTNNFGLDQKVLNEFAGCIGLGIQALEVK